MNKLSRSLLNELCSQYELVTEQNKNSVLKCFSANLSLTNGVCYVRRMAATQFFCVASIELDDALQRQGVLTAFIEYIRENPHDYKGIEVECIHNKELANSLRKRGWVDRKSSSFFEREHSPTLHLAF